MSLPVWMPYALCGAALIGLGLYGLLADPRLLRRVLAFNVIGSGIFLLLGALAGRGGTGATDPVPQAMIITGIVVAISATALALGLIVAHARAGGGEGLPGDTGHPADAGDPRAGAGTGDRTFPEDVPEDGGAARSAAPGDAAAHAARPSPDRAPR